jgi:succinate-semialdehyde dehydrogenase/glutarate-semialdehyde dehydrogenase
MKLQDSTLFQQLGFIDGTWVGADGGTTLAVHNPADGERLGSIPNMGVQETRRAIEVTWRF